MTMVVRTTYVAATVRTMPAPLECGAIPGTRSIEEPIAAAHRYEAITSLQALSLAVAASVLVTTLLWFVL